MPATRRSWKRRSDWSLPKVGIAAAAAASFGWSAAAQTIEDLGRLSIDDLAHIQVTSVSRRPEALNSAPSAIYVITAEDIRRSGATSLPEALRLAPNLEVARLNAYNYAVTARGFNSPEASNKLLVLVDGRSVYSPFAATVFWESVDVLLEDVERIEVISGPGGTLWGANAVNGVINVITHHSRDTQGTMVSAGIGSDDRDGAVRHGGRLGDNATYRVYASGFDRSDSQPLSSADMVEDAFRGYQAGFRVDAGQAGEEVTLQGDLYRNHTEFLDQTLFGGNLLARWTHRFAETSSLQLQAYYDRKVRDYAIATDAVETYDVQAQHNFRLGQRHQIVWGGGYRLWRSRFDSYVPFGFEDPTASLWVGSGYVQDEVRLAENLKLTVGLKVESNNFTGAELMPSVRLAWMLDPKHMVWGAVSRAVRTPSRIDRELSAPGLFAAASNFQAEDLVAYEVGYRGQPAAGASLSVSLFYNVYDRLRTTVLTGGTPPLTFGNDLEGSTYGLEAWGSYSLASWWRLRAGGNAIGKDLRVKDGVVDLSNKQAAGQDPSYQAQLRSEMTVAPGIDIDLALRRVAHVFPTQVPAYTELDAHLAWQVTPNIRLSLHGFNLLNERRLEVDNPATSPPRYTGRSVYARLRADF